MGNSSSSGGSLNLVVFPPENKDPALSGYYVAGSTVRGAIYAYSTEENASQMNSNVASIEVYFAGKENVKVSYDFEEFFEDEEGERRSRRVPRQAYASRDIFRVTIPLIPNFDGAAGRYEYPFEVALPIHLPTSMSHYDSDVHGHGHGHGHGFDNGYGHSSNQYEYCEIVYKIKAQMNGWFGWKEEYELPVMGAMMPIAPVPHNIQPHTKNVKFCCCFDKGAITFGAAVDDTRVARGEQINISFACKNESTAEIQHVRAELEEYVWWSAQGETSHSSKCLYERNFERTEKMDKLSKSQLGNLEDLNSDDPNQAREMMQNDMRDIFHTIQSNDNTVSLSVPYSAHHSYMGQCCGVSHVLKIIIKTSGGVTNPEVEIPICIGTVSERTGYAVLAEPLDNEDFDDQPPETPEVPQMQGPGPAGPIVPSAPPLDWESDVIVPSVAAPTSDQVLIEAVVQSEQEIDLSANSVPTVPVIVATETPSVESLIRELQVSISASSTVKKRVEDESWKDGVFSPLTPSEYVSIIEAVTIEFDQTEVAAAIAPVINQFNCEYIVAVIQNVAEWMRVTMVKRLIPHVDDFDTNSDSILSELTDWEKMSTEQDFQNRS